MDNALTVRESDLQQAVTPESLKAQVNVIQQAMQSVMIEGVHYGKVPGCGDKPALLKPGAEKIGLLFRMVAKFEIQRENLPGGHREYTITCTLVDRDQRMLGQGVGSCSTMEKKYRWREGLGEDTGEPVPPDYWTLKKTDFKAAAKLLNGRIPKRDPALGLWSLWTRGERIENPDIADQYNTVLKMAKKRAHVDAILTTTAASDIFDQDIDEDLDDDPLGGEEPQFVDPPPATAPRYQPSAPQDKPVERTTGETNKKSVHGERTLYCYKLPFDLKDTAKQNGGRWNSGQKTWDFKQPQSGWEGYLAFGPPEQKQAAAVLGDDEPPPYEPSNYDLADDLPGV